MELKSDVLPVPPPPPAPAPQLLDSWVTVEGPALAVTIRRLETQSRPEIAVVVVACRTVQL